MPVGCSGSILCVVSVLRYLPAVRADSNTFAMKSLAVIPPQILSLKLVRLPRGKGQSDLKMNTPYGSFPCVVLTPGNRPTFEIVTDP
ncbi:hypothetical protein OAF83_03840 [Rubripirellula sp.]|nr:hypothetical protein [Rubripirellula sp.]MDB4750017.1 hypothetical protein [Rubripirellula sp.]